MNPVVASDKLKRTEVWVEHDESFAGPARSRCTADTARRRRPISCTRSSPGNGSGGTPMPRKTQYIIAGNGELHMEDGSVHKVGPDSVFVVPTPIKHDLVNVGRETLRAVAFFAAAMFTRNFDKVMLPPKSHILGTLNREG